MPSGRAEYSFGAWISKPIFLFVQLLQTTPGKCGGKGGDSLRKDVKDLCKREFGKNVRINTAGCLGQCEFGIAAVMYPQGKWFLELKKKDDEKLFEAVKKAVRD